MNLSSNYQRLAFVSFSSSFCPASWSTYSSMSCEAEQKSGEKSYKNQTFLLCG